jgi:hypothetical protein
VEDGDRYCYYYCHLEQDADRISREHFGTTWMLDIAAEGEGLLALVHVFRVKTPSRRAALLRRVPCSAGRVGASSACAQSECLLQVQRPARKPCACSTLLDSALSALLCSALLCTAPASAVPSGMEAQSREHTIRWSWCLGALAPFTSAAWRQRSSNQSGPNHSRPCPRRFAGMGKSD